MRQHDILNADKNIVERPKVHADDHAREAVRSLRSGLGSKQVETDHFVGDLLQRHARSRQNLSLVILLLTLVGAALSYPDLPFTIMLSWLACGLAMLAWSLGRVRQFLALEVEEIDTKAWERTFQSMQFLSGTVWRLCLLFIRWKGKAGNFRINICISDGAHGARSHIEQQHPLWCF